MELNGLDQVLPMYVDYVGRFENESFQDACDVLREFVQRGAQGQRRVDNCEVSFKDGYLVLRGIQQGVVEAFNLHRIKNPVAFKKRHGHEGSVKQEGKRGLGRMVIFTEIGSGHFLNDVFHVFECPDNEPEELVERIKEQTFRLYREEDSKRLKRNSSIVSTPSHNGTPGSTTSSLCSFKGTNSVRSLATIKRGDSKQRASIFLKDGLVAAAPPTPPSRQKGDLQMSVVSQLSTERKHLDILTKPSIRYFTVEDRVVKDTILLNYCIDDIERFCAELKRFQWSLTCNLDQRGVGRRPMSVDEIVRAKQEEYNATDFIVLFQKFKLAFNLLARLDGLIHEPSARTLLHCLFPPLAFLLDESHELFHADLVSDIVSPLPTKKAVDMLNNYLGEREHKVWMALGDYWSNPTSEWEGDIVSYQPRFHDGWSPGIIDFSEDDLEFDLTERRSTLTNESQLLPSRKMSTRSNSGSRSGSASQEGQDEYRDNLMDSDAMIGLVMFSRQANNQHELSVAKGQYLEILDDSKNWWQCQNISDQVGYVPCTLIRRLIYEEGVSRDESKKSFSAGMHSTEHRPDNGKDKKAPAEEIHFDSMNRRQDPASNGRRSGSSSTSGSTIREEEVRVTLRKTNQSLVNQKQQEEAPLQSQSIPLPPPLPTRTDSQETTIKQPEQRTVIVKDGIGTVRSNVSMQDELKSVLEVFREKESKLDISSTPEAYISERSTVHEVKEWLRIKQFSQRAVDELRNFDGRRLLSMSRDQLVSAFGKDEGGRMDGQLTICRKTTGFNTAKTSELKEVLKKVRQRAERGEDDSNVQLRSTNR